MAVIYLHGYLAKKYGKRFELAVHSVGEAISLLNANFRGFNADLLNHQQGFIVKRDGVPIIDMAGVRSTGISPEIHIVPAIRGAGGDSKGIGQIVFAAILIAAAYSGYVPAGTEGAFFNAGINMAVSGVATLLFSTTLSKSDTQNELTGETNKASYAFNGPVNTTAQGNPVPVLYGRLIVGSQVISAGITSA